MHGHNCKQRKCDVVYERPRYNSALRYLLVYRRGLRSIRGVISETEKGTESLVGTSIALVLFCFLGSAGIS